MTDAERLDWLEARLKREGDATLGWSREDRGFDEWSGRSVTWPESFWIDDETAIDPPRKSLRDAIDAAMEQDARLTESSTK